MSDKIAALVMVVIYLGLAVIPVFLWQFLVWILEPLVPPNRTLGRPWWKSLVKCGCLAVLAAPCILGLQEAGVVIPMYFGFLSLKPGNDLVVGSGSIIGGFLWWIFLLFREGKKRRQTHQDEGAQRRDS